MTLWFLMKLIWNEIQWRLKILKSNQTRSSVGSSAGNWLVNKCSVNLCFVELKTFHLNKKHFALKMFFDIHLKFQRFCSQQNFSLTSFQLSVLTFSATGCQIWLKLFRTGEAEKSGNWRYLNNRFKLFVPWQFLIWNFILSNYLDLMIKKFAKFPATWKTVLAARKKKIFLGAVNIQIMWKIVPRGKI